MLVVLNGVCCFDVVCWCFCTLLLWSGVFVAHFLFLVFLPCWGFCVLVIFLRRGLYDLAWRFVFYCQFCVCCFCDAGDFVLVFVFGFLFVWCFVVLVF